jgi:hypothetical protein
MILEEKICKKEWKEKGVKRRKRASVENLSEFVQKLKREKSESFSSLSHHLFVLYYPLTENP